MISIDLPQFFCDLFPYLNSSLSTYDLYTLHFHRSSPDFLITFFLSFNFIKNYALDNGLLYLFSTFFACNMRVVFGRRIPFVVSFPTFYLFYQ